MALDTGGPYRIHKPSAELVTPVAPTGTRNQCADEDEIFPVTKWTALV
ncbi:hypothetical protein CLV35_0457 [Motilibacter peucedani]|uniref:Uncharacterized protein n=1 Tax=Motilibacter peucedani TaxID=598650 RepID=A0A420XT86_9ACTN|nr:hypothetical protein CLV35_0457 [Motilibacter peucedani]